MRPSAAPVMASGGGGGFASAEVEVDLEGIEIPDAYINERFKLAIENDERGELDGVKLIQIGASPVYEVVEDFSVAFKGRP